MTGLEADTSKGSEREREREAESRRNKWLSWGAEGAMHKHACMHGRIIAHISKLVVGFIPEKDASATWLDNDASKHAFSIFSFLFFLSLLFFLLFFFFSFWVIAKEILFSSTPWWKRAIFMYKMCVDK